MRKRLTAFVALLVAFVLFAASVSGALQVAPSIAKPDAALGSTDEILKVVSRLRGLDIKQNVKSSFKSKDEIEQAVIKDLDENTPREEFEATEKTLVKLGLITREFRLRDYVVKLLREQVAGFYEPKTKEFYLAAWLRAPGSALQLAPLRGLAKGRFGCRACRSRACRRRSDAGDDRV